MGRSSPGSRFPPAMRLSDPRVFARAKETGRRLSRGTLALNWLLLPAGSVSQLGIITSRKMGAATERNRARRLLRESFRRHQQDMACPAQLIIIARRSIVGKKFAEVEVDFLAALRQAGLLRYQDGTR